jgi:hypothetical protein
VSVVELGALHGRYVRVSDRFKAMWTYHQFASGTFRNLLDVALPYDVDFPAVYEGIKAIAGMLNEIQAGRAVGELERAEHSLGKLTKTLLAADDRISPSHLRRFFEKLKRQDDNIIFYLIKFYLYGDAVEGDRRDKLDFLFTRIGEDFLPERGEYVSRDSLEFRERVIALVGVLHVAPSPREEVVRMIRAVRSMRDDVLTAATFDEMTERGLVRSARTFKHRIGDFYFDPDVLIAIIELNIATKNGFLRLYEGDRLADEAEKLLEHGNALERNFGDANPGLAEDFARFREYKERFDTLRAESNLKHDVISRLKSSMSTILAQLDRGLDAGAGETQTIEELPGEFFDETRHVENVRDRFGRDEPLLTYLLRIASGIDLISPSLPLEDVLQLPCARELRLEEWELAAYQKLFDRRPAEAEEDGEELWVLYLRAAALRLKVDEEATSLATAMAAGVRPDADLLPRARRSLDVAKELDEQFGDLLQEAVYYANPRILRQLYRSRFRLLRGFSGLWLIYDRQS